MSTLEQERTERRLAAILMADVVGYSRLMGKNEDGTHLALKAVQREVTDPKVAEHRGRLVKTIGDGLLVEFASVVDAVRCAVDIQRAMALRNVRAAADDPIVFRIGINLGDIISEDGDIYGDGVNVAARLEGLARPGGICVSRVVRDQVRDKLGFGFEDMGPQRVKNIARPIHVFRVPLDATPRLTQRRPSRSPNPARPANPGPASGFPLRSAVRLRRSARCFCSLFLRRGRARRRARLRRRPRRRSATRSFSARTRSFCRQPQKRRSNAKLLFCATTQRSP